MFPIENKYAFDNIRSLKVLVQVQTSDPQTSDGTNLRLTNVGPGKTSDITNVRPLQTSDQCKRRTKKNKYLNYKIFKKFIFLCRLQSNKNLPKETEFFPLTQIFSSLYICNLIMVLTFDTFKFKLFYFEDFIG